MGDEFKCLDRDRDCRGDDFIGHERDDFGFGDWLPIIIIVFLLCGGTNIFGGFGGRDDCFDNNGFGGFGGSSWLLILVVLFLFLGNSKDGRGGFLGGLFG